MLITALCGLAVTTSVVGQTTYIWTNQVPTHPASGDLGVSTNWSPNGTPSPGNGDTMEWNGSTTGDMALTIKDNLGGSSGQVGLTCYMNASQTANLQIGPVAGVNSSQPRWNNVLIDAGAGQFTLGDDSANSLEIVWGSAFTQTMENNSTYPAIIKPNLLWRNGGGGSHYWLYRGTGDWIVNNYMRSDNTANGTGLIKDGTGTLTWYGTNIAAATINGIIVAGGLEIDTGTVIMKSPDLITSAGIKLDPNNTGGTLLKYDATNGLGNFSGVLSGSGPLQVNAGSLTLSGANTYTGSNYLTGGELTVFHAENLGTNGPLGVGGLISFAGGTLGYSSANSYDYSARFDTSPGQQYSLDVPSGGTVTLAAPLTSSGGSLTKLGGGSLTLSATNSYSGQTTVSDGNLVISGKVGSGNITVADGKALTVVENGAPVQPATMTLGTGAGVVLNFNNLTNTTTAPIAVTGAITTGGAITVNVNSGAYNAIGQTFPLISWGSGSAPAFNNSPSVSGAAGTLAVVGNTLVLTIAATPYTWTGGASAVWDTTTSGNWKQQGTPIVWANGALTLFDDSAVGNTNVTIVGDLLPSGVTVDSEVLNYTFTSSPGNLIDGSGGLTLSGNSTVKLTGGANAYTGATTISGGSLSVLSVSTLANSGLPSDIGASSSGATNLVLNNGTLQYTGGGATIDRQFSVGLDGATIDSSGSGALALTANETVGLVGSGTHPLALTGTNSAPNTLAANIADNIIGVNNFGATLLTKDGPNTWILLGTNTYSGVTTLHNGGTLQIGNGGGSGTLGSGAINVNDNSGLNFNRAGTLTVSAAITGTGSLTNNGPGTLILTGNSTYAGDTVVNAGILQLGNGGSTGTLAGNANITNNSMLVFDTTGSPSYSGGGIYGTGNVEVKAGTLKAIGNDDYTGWTLIDSGATFIPTDDNVGNTATLATSVVTNNGILLLLGYSQRTAMYANIVGSGKVQLSLSAPWSGNDNTFQESCTAMLGGTNTYTGGTYISSANLQFGDGSTPGAGSFVGNIIFTNNLVTSQDNAKRVIFNRPDDFTITGNIVTNYSGTVTHFGILEQDGSGVLTLTGTNTYGSGTHIVAGTVQVGNGGTRGTIGSGDVVNDSVLVWNRSDAVTFGGAITGSGSFVNFGSGSLTLGNTNLAYTGSTTVSNGTLIVTGEVVPGTTTVGGADLDLEGGTLILGASGTVETNIVANNLYIGAGTIVFTLNKSVAASNTVIAVTNFASSSAGSINITGGTLKLVNAGPALHVGDKFTLFPVYYPGQITGAGSLTLVTPGFAVNSANLGVDGSVTVTSVVAAPTIAATVSGSSLNLSWPSNWIGTVHLQSQTNTLAIGLSTNWVTIPGTDLGNTYSVTINPTNPAVFYRLAP